MTDSEAIDALGGTTFVAEVLKIKPPSVSGWRENGIPTGRKQTLALLFPDKVPQSWKELLPTDPKPVAA